MYFVLNFVFIVVAKLTFVIVCLGYNCFWDGNCSQEELDFLYLFLNSFFGLKHDENLV